MPRLGLTTTANMPPATSNSELFVDSSLNNRSLMAMSSSGSLNSPLTCSKADEIQFHALCRTPKLFLKKQDAKKMVNYQLPVKKSSITTTKTAEFKRIDSIRFEKKTLYSKSDQSPVDSSALNDDFYIKRVHLSSGKKTVGSRAPLRCLLDSGQSEPDRTSSGEFRAYVLAENSRNEFFSVFERNRTSDEFPNRQKEIYDRFRSSRGANKRKPLGPSILSSSTPNFLMVNTKM